MTHKRPYDSESTAMGCLFWLMALFVTWVFVMALAGLVKIGLGVA